MFDGLADGFEGTDIHIRLGPGIFLGFTQDSVDGTARGSIVGEDNVDAPVVVVVRTDYLDVFDIHRVVVVFNPITVDDGDEFHGVGVFGLDKFSNVFQQVGKSVEVVGKVEPVSVELGNILVADQSSGHFQVGVFPNHPVEYFIEEFFVSHILVVFISHYKDTTKKRDFQIFFELFFKKKSRS